MEGILYILRTYLTKEGYAISETSIKERLYSDPEKNVSALTNTLDYFSVENIVASFPRDSFSNLPRFFIAQIKQVNKSSFVLVEKISSDTLKIVSSIENSFTSSVEEFKSFWTGMVVLVEKNDLTNTGFLKTTILQSIGRVIIPLQFLLTYVFIVSESKTVTATYYFLTVVGLYFSYLILKEKFYITEKGSSKICTILDATDCQSVLLSKESKLFNLLDLSDASVIYFLLLAVSVPVFPNSSAFFFIAAISMVFVVYSLYTQVFKIGKLCTFCIGIIVVLLSQFLLLAVNYNGDFPKIHELFFLLSLTLLLPYLGKKIKNIFSDNLELNALKLDHLKIKRDYNLFLPYYHHIEEYSVDVSSKYKVSLGAENPSIELDVVFNPFCQSCTKTQLVLEKLIESHRSHLRVNYYFLPSQIGRLNKKTSISIKLIQIYFEYGRDKYREALQSWFDIMHIADWLQIWGTSFNQKYIQHLNEHVKWCLSNDVEGTPTIFMNKKQIPSVYSISDIENFIVPVMDWDKNIRA